MICVDLYLKKKKSIKYGITSHLRLKKNFSKLQRKSLIRVDSYKKIDKYLKKAYPKDF